MGQKEIRQKITNFLKDKPQKYGFVQTSWSLPVLAKAASKLKIVKKISFVRIWQILKEEDYSYQKSKNKFSFRNFENSEMKNKFSFRNFENSEMKNWIQSSNPQYELKKD